MRFDDLLDEATRTGVNLSDVAAKLESEETGASIDEIRSKVKSLIMVMMESVSTGLSGLERKSRSGLSGGDAHKAYSRMLSGKSLPGNTLVSKAIAYSLAVSEVNANMGRIVAAPTAGSCGTIPGAFLSLAEAQYPGFSTFMGPSALPNIDTMNEAVDALGDALLTAGVVGQVIADKASLSGAIGGCQAECGSAAAMAAAGLCQMGGGMLEDCIHAAVLAIKGLMGLVCDPVCGLVEVPCVKRNATSAAVAISCAEMALSGVRSRIPPDEVVEAMAQVGRSIPSELRETSGGGLAVTPTAKKIGTLLA